MRALLITYVWPEPKSSAAGTRTLNVIDALLTGGWSLDVGSPSALNSHAASVAERGAKTHVLRPNTEDLARLLDSTRPDGGFDLVVFDRFVTEEMFGWVVGAKCPGAARVIDTQDLHFLRRHRQAGVEAGRDFTEVARETPPASDPTLLRELGAILRSDLTFLLSDHEAALLTGAFGVSQEKIHLSGIGVDPRPVPIDGRHGFSWIGNHRHPPNADSLRWLAAELWPRIRARLPHATVDLWGAYPPRDALMLDDPSMGFRVRGPAESATDAIARARVLLAPLRFGAGIKGKVLDAWSTSTPVCATSIAAEGLSPGTDTTAPSWGGLVADDPDGWASAAVSLHEDAEIWKRCSDRAWALATEVHARSRVLARIQDGIAIALRNARSRDSECDLTTRLLRFHGWRSNEYFSKWISEKERKR